MGLFGGNRRKALGSAIDIGAIQDQARLEGDGTLPTMPKRPGLFGQGGKGWDVLGGTADTLLQMRGAPPVYNDGSSERLRQLILQAQIAQQTHQANRQYDLENPAPPAPNDTERDYQFWKERLTPEQFNQWLANRVYSPPHFGVVDGVPAMIGGYGGNDAPPSAPVGKLTPLGGAGPQAPRPFP